MTGKFNFIVWLLCYFSVVSRHMVSESWYMAKSALHLTYGLSEQWLSTIDSSYMFASTTGNLITGSMVDKYNLSSILLSALTISSTFYMFTAIAGYIPLTSPWVYLFFTVIQGVVQSPVYPACVSLLGHSFSAKVRGKTMSLLSTSISFGNFLGASVTGVLMTFGLSWMTTMLIYSFIELLIGCLLFLSITKQSKAQKIQDTLLSYPGMSKKKTLSMWGVLNIPYVKSVVFCKMCVKSLYYSLTMWVPFYLSSFLMDPSWVGFISGAIEIGGIAGAVFCGFLTDYLDTRPPVLQVYLFAPIPILVTIGLQLCSSNWALFFLFFAAGFCIGGASLILITAVPIDLAQQPSMKDYEVIGSITAILDASGSLGAAFGVFMIGYLIPMGWVYVFLQMFMTLILAFFTLTPYSISEFQRLRLKNSR